MLAKKLIAKKKNNKQCQYFIETKNLILEKKNI